MAAAAAAAANTCRRCYMFARAFSSAAAVNGTDKMAMIRTLRAHTGAPISEVHLDRPSVVIIASYDVGAPPTPHTHIHTRHRESFLLPSSAPRPAFGPYVRERIMNDPFPHTCPHAYISPSQTGEGLAREERV